jgi:hypothetical protein
MAQTNFTPILLYASSTPTAVPSAGNLTNSATGSEIAINVADKNLFFKDSTNAVNTVPIRQSSTSSNGWLSATDWNTFNGKAPATSGTSILYGNGSGGFSNVTIGTGITFAGGTLSATGSGGTVTSVTGTSPVVSSGGTTPAISMPAATTSVNGYLTSTDWNTFNSKQPAGTYVTSVGATSPVTSSGGTTPTIAMPAATTSVSGYLTSTDWNTFNNKGSGTVTSVSGTTGRITSTSGATPVIDLASGVATAGTTGSSTLIPVVTIDTYGRVTSITTASNPQGTVTSVTGTAPVVSSGGATPAISMAAANTTTNGYLTSTDWNTFNGKGSGTVTSVAALTLGTTGTDLSSTVATGTTTPVITLNVPTASATNRGALSAADWTTFNNKGNGTVTSVTGTAPVVSSGGATPAISMTAATTSVNGYLTSTDWTTFNGKQAALVSGTNIKTVGGVSLLGSGDVGTIGVAYGGTGLTSLTAKYIPFGNGTSAFGSSSNFVWDNTNGRLGIGFSSPTAQIEIAGYPNATFKISDGGSGSYTFSRQAGDGYFHSVDDSGSYGFIWASGANEIMRTFASRGVSIGNTTDPGTGNLSITSNGNSLFTMSSSAGAYSSIFTMNSSSGGGSQIKAPYSLICITGGSGGVYLASGGVAWLAYSDETLKTDLAPIENALDKISRIRSVTGRYKTDPEGTSRAFFIAQDLEKEFPQVVSKNSIDGTLMASYTETAPLLLAAINELQTKFDAYVASHP